jgi:hypothetical protein
VPGLLQVFFFDPLASATGFTNSVGRFRDGSLDFQHPLSNRRPTHTRDRGNLDRAATPPLVGQQSYEQPFASFVERDEDTIDRLMLSGDLSLRRLVTVNAKTLSNNPLLVSHDPSPRVDTILVSGV